jgi:acyl-CoA synthetase (AMP-forming)/AMP-acid ligase II
MIFHSPFPDVTIPEMSITSFALRHTMQLADKPALIDGLTGRSITYGQLEILVRRLAIGLAERGFGKGDVLAIYSPNVLEYAIAVHGTIAAGGAVTTINPLATAHELANQLKDSRAVYLVTTPALLPNALQAADWSHVRETFVFGEAETARPFDVLLADDGPWPAVAVEPRADVALLPYSSGTTGLPKGVMLTHYNLIANSYQVEGFDLLAEDDTVVAFLPFFHLYGLFGFLTYGLAAGATIVTMPRFDLEHYLQLLQDYRSQRAYVVPPVLLGLARHPMVERYDLSSLRSILSAAAPAGADLCSTIQARLGAIVKQAYGMTELSPVSHLIPESAPRVGAGGLVVRNTEVKIIDIDTGRELGPHQRGEIWVRGPQVMRGYLNRPEATAETITPDGWLKTGDIGYADEDGYFYIVDRLKELIKVKAYQVAPAELEALLVTHPAVADAAVIGVPDAEAGELPKAFIVPRGAADSDEIMAFVAERVAPYKKVRLIEFIDQIPKSASGKILRRVLRERQLEPSVVASPTANSTSAG